MAHRAGMKKLETASLGMSEGLAMKIKNHDVKYDVFADLKRRGSSDPRKEERQTASANNVLQLSSSTRITGSSPRSGVAGLRSIHLAGQFVTDIDCKRIATTCPLLTCLDLSNNTCVSDVGTKLVLRDCRHLSKLYIFQTSVTDASFSGGPRSLKVLGPSTLLSAGCIQSLRQQGVHVEVDHETMTTELLLSLSDMILPWSATSGSSAADAQESGNPTQAQTRTGPKKKRPKKHMNIPRQL